MCKTFLLFLALILSACSLPYAGVGVPTFTAAFTPSPTELPPVTQQSCYFNWSTHSLPDLTKQVQAALDAAGLDNVTGIAEAFGEDCYGYQNNESLGFTAMETDYRFSVKVRDLKDAEALGNLVEQILKVVEQFPTETTPGPKPGYVGIAFLSGEQDLRLWFLLEDARAALEKGLHGADLLEAVQKK